MVFDFYLKIKRNLKRWLFSPNFTKIFTLNKCWVGLLFLKLLVLKNVEFFDLQREMILDWDSKNKKEKDCSKFLVFYRVWCWFRWKLLKSSTDREQPCARLAWGGASRRRSGCSSTTKKPSSTSARSASARSTPKRRPNAPPRRRPTRPTRPLRWLRRRWRRRLRRRRQRRRRRRRPASIRTILISR